MYQGPKFTNLVTHQKGKSSFPPCTCAEAEGEEEAEGEGEEAWLA